MNILHLMKDYKPTIGGSVVRNGNMVDAYKFKYPSDQIFIVNLEGDKYEKESSENGITVFRASSIYEMIQIASKLIDNSIDVIHAHNFRFLYAAYVARLKAKRKPKLFVEIHAMYNMSWYKEKLSFFLLRRVDKIIVLAECAKKYLVSHCDIEKKKIFVVRNGIESNIKKKKVIDIRFRDELLKLKEKYRIVLYTGSFFEWQGVNFLANNFDRILESIPQIAVVMVGNGPDFQYVEDKYKVTNNKERIMIHKGVSKSEILDLYDISDIIIIPRLKNLSTNTAVPLKVIEPMELERNILSANDDGLCEVLNNNNSTLFESGDIESLISALKEMMIDDKERKKKAKQAKHDALELFISWGKSAEVMHGLYGGE